MEALFYPQNKPPSLPKEEIKEDLDEYKSKESSEVEEVEAEHLEVPILEEETFKEEDEQLVVELEVNEEIINIPIEPIIPKKAKEEKNYDEKYFKPRRKRMVDYLPEALPKRMVRDDIQVEPMKFSTAVDNCVTKTLFVGSQYVGNSGGQRKA